MQRFSMLKNIILLITIIALMGLLAFTLERSEINDIININIEGNEYLDSEKYLEFANLNNIEEKANLNIALIQDRLEKHPYIENADVVMLERGIVEVTIKEQKFDAILLSNGKQFLVSNKAEILPSLSSTRNINLPLIIDETNRKNSVFSSASKSKDLMCALKIISASEVYDKHLCESISEICLNKDKSITLNMTDIPFPIYLGQDNEIAKTIYLSKILNHLQRNDLSKYLNYVDLRFNDLVYLGFKEDILPEKENI